MQLILASTSPYRKAQLERLGIHFNTMPPEVNEQEYKDRLSTPRELAKQLAHAKAHDCLKKCPDSDVVVIGGDQVLAFQDQILGKPHTQEKAMEQLLMLQGKNHQLITCIAIATRQETKEFTCIANMQMRPLSAQQIQRYIDKDQPLNTCGSYKLEEAGICLFEKIDCEDYTSIIGMPLIYITTALQELGFQVL